MQSNLQRDNPNKKQLRNKMQNKNAPGSLKYRVGNIYHTCKAKWFPI